ncbi:MAG: hypothetical protein E6713_06155 [Sporomusaceae bacterium]|nr:hypothetical protein [Sporomusaceae bacterium]
MDFNEFSHRIAETESIEDWLYDEGSGRITLRSDLSISIFLPRTEDNRVLFEERWLQQLQNPQAYASDYFFCYNGVPVYRARAISIDSGLGIIPLPNPNMTISQNTYAVGRILNHFGIDFDRYLQRLGITVA